MTTTVNVRFQWRRDTAANWTAANPVLLDGETGYETNTKKFKIGDGVTAWNSLAYTTTPVTWGAITGSLASQTDLKSALDDKAGLAYVNSTLAGYAPLASPTLTGDPKAPTPATGDNDTSIATSAFVQNTIAALGAAVAYTPVVTANSGAITTSAASGHYCKIGKLVFFTFSVTVTTAGTAAGATLNATLPSIPAVSITCVGKNNGLSCTGQVTNLSNVVQIRRYDNNSILADGASVRMTGMYIEN